MPRAIWSGSLGFGVVQIAVALYAVEEPNELSLTLLDKHDFSPVGDERINKKTGKKVKPTHEHARVSARMRTSGAIRAIWHCPTTT